MSDWYGSQGPDSDFADEEPVSPEAAPPRATTLEDADAAFLFEYAATLRRSAEASRKKGGIFGPECVEVQAPIFERIADRLATLTARIAEAERDAELGRALREAVSGVAAIDVLCIDPHPSLTLDEAVFIRGPFDQPDIANDATRALAELLRASLDTTPQETP